MILKVGEKYRAIFAGEPSWLLITKIEMRDDCCMVYFVNIGILPKWLKWLGTSSETTGPCFVNRIDEAARIDRRGGRYVSEVEVRYR